MDIKVQVPRSVGAPPSLSLLPAPRPGQSSVVVELPNGNTITFDGYLDDLFGLFATGHDMLSAFLFGPESRLFPSQTPAESETVEVG